MKLFVWGFILWAAGLTLITIMGFLSLHWIFMVLPAIATAVGLIMMIAFAMQKWPWLFPNI